MKKSKTTSIEAVANEPIATAEPSVVPTLKKLSLAGFATQTPASKSAKAYPLLPDPDGPNEAELR